LGLMVLAGLPWFAAVIKSAELPGGWKIEFQDVQTAGAKITTATTPASLVSQNPHPSYLDISDRDPNLALVGLRIELEKRLRALAERNGISESRSLGRTFADLRSRGVLDEQTVVGLQELIMAGNQAAHGARVAPQAATWAIEHGPKVLSVLDAKLEELR
jgi:hypothetical protein